MEWQGRKQNAFAPNEIKLFAMNSRLLLSLLLAGLLLPSGSAWARDDWRDLPADDRQELRQQMREQWQRQNFQPQREPRDMAVPAWREFPPEERQRLRDELREQQDRRGHRGGRRGRGED